MSLPEIQHATSLLTKSSNILLLVPKQPSADSFSSMVALYLALLKSHSGSTDAVSPSHVPPHLQFLPGSSQTLQTPKMQPDIVLDIAGPDKAIDVRQEALNGGLRIHILLPERTKIQKDSIETHVRQMPYDCAVVFGTRDLEELGDLFTNHADFFYNTPTVNIDNKASNEHFGTINIVDITSSSIAEIAHDIIKALPHTSIESDIATALYAGIVSATESFQRPSTTPHAFQLSAQLMQKKADAESVVQHLVKTKPLPVLKLTGRAYARLRHDEYGNMFWSVLRQLDFHESGANHQHIPAVMKELTGSISNFNVAFLVYEKEDGTFETALILGKGLGKRRKDMQSHLSASIEQDALIFSTQASTIQEAEQHIVEYIREVLSQWIAPQAQLPSV